MHTTLALLNETEYQRYCRFGRWYDNYRETHEEEPAVVTVHRVVERWGGPEEGGWYYHPVINVCVFSRAQAVEELLRLHAIYETEEYEGEDYDINLSRNYGSEYPERKPHYE
jgi:hypothetical protein